MEENDYTTIHLASGAAWRTGATTNGLVAMDDDGLALAGEMVHGLDRRLGLAGRLRPTALVADRCGVLTLLADEALYTFDPGSGLLEPLSCVGGRGRCVGRFNDPHALALGRHNLYVADTGNHRVCVFATVNRQLRRIIGAVDREGRPLPGTLPGECDHPLDLAVDEGDRLYLLDAGNRRIQRFDRYGEPSPDVPPFGAGLLENPVALALGGAAPGTDGPLVHCLDLGRRQIVSFDCRGRHLGSTDLTGLDFEPVGLAVDAEGKFYLADRERFIYAIRSAADWSPLEEYQGGALRLFPGPSGEFYAVEDGEIARLTRRRRYPPAGAWTGSGPATGIYISRPFDTCNGRLFWHRAILDAEIPDKTQLRFSYFIYEPGREQGLLPGDGEWRSFPPNPADVLLDRQEGRHLRVRLELISEEPHSTPRVRGLQLLFPKQSYLRYLPAAYQEDERGRDFLERFLSLFESVFHDLERQALSSWQYADPAATPAAFLPWLASWLALPVDDDWLADGGDRLRRLLLAAPGLYRQRGTRSGIAGLVALYTGTAPFIVEPFQLDCIAGKAEWHETLRLFGTDPYHFTVLLPLGSAGRVEAVERLVERERPAHTGATVVALEPLFRLGGHTYLEVNTVLNQPRFTLETAALLARETYLADGESAGQAEVWGRTAIDTYLK